MIIELSDESDTENPQTSNHDKPASKSEIDNDKLAKLEAKRKLEEKEREIKLMNELIATQLELINKKKGLTQSSSSSPSTPTITTTITATATANLKATSTTTTPTSPSTINPITENLAVIRAEIDAYEIAKSTVTDLKNKISSKEKEIENYQLNLHEHDNNIEKYRKQLLEINNQKNDIINKKTELQKKQTDLEAQMLKIKEELSVLQENEEKLTKDEEVCQTKEKEINSSKIMLTKNINNLAEIIQNLKKDLATMNKEMISKKDKLKKLAEKMPNKQKNESSETSTTNATILDIQSNITTINDNGKRTISSESSGNFQQQDSLMKKPKLTINQSEVDQLGKRFDELRDQNKKILENISNLNKQKNDGKISMKGVTATNGENFQSLNTNNNLLNNNKNNNVKSSPAIRKGSNGPSNYSANNYVNQDGSLGNDDFEPLVPYASPLMAFKSFRFHPNYKELVGDYKSMTYSNSLNVQHKVCLWESHKKGRCNDFECMSQHWRQFKMNDEQVIQDMASYVEGRTPEEKEIYRAGMIKLLEDLKEKGIVDLEESVEAIKKYRNDFCNSHRIDDLPGPHYISFNKKFPLNHNKEVQQHDVPASPRSDTNYDYISESETSLILPPSPNLAFILDYNIDSDTNLAYQSSPNNVQMSDDNNNSDDSDDSDDNDASYIREPGSNDVSPSSSNENQLNVYQGEAQEEHTSNNLAGTSYYMSTDGGFEADSENSDNGNDNQNFEEPVTPDDPGVEASEPIEQQTTEPQQGGYSGLGVIGRLYNWFR
nr:8104_t:CDS:1 [Entrophospora candida]CAG8616894.1 4408_t:CDS:1 [Entrophospora candida]